MDGPRFLRRVYVSEVLARVPEAGSCCGRLVRSVGRLSVLDDEGVVEVALGSKNASRRRAMSLVFQSSSGSREYLSLMVIVKPSWCIVMGGRSG